MRNLNRGSVLMLTMFFLLVISTLASVAWSVTGSANRGDRMLANRQRAIANLEAKLEYAYGVWNRRLNENSRPITGNEANDGLADVAFLPESGFTSGTTSASGYSLTVVPLDEFGVARSGTLAPVGVNEGVAGYSGWRGTSYKYSAQATTRLDPNDPSSQIVSINRTFEYSQVPLFQSTLFVQNDLELIDPARMVLSGLVHTNGNAYINTRAQAGVPSLTVAATVTYSGLFSETAPAYVTSTASLVSASYPDGKDNQVRPRSAIRPLGADLEELFASSGAGTNPNLSSRYREIIEVADTSVDDPLGNRRIASAASIQYGIVVKSDYTCEVTVSSPIGSTITGSGLTALGAVVSGTAVQIYDPKEKKVVNLVDFDIGKFKDAVAGSPGPVSDFADNAVVYVYTTTTTTGVTGSTPNLNAIRLINGRELPDNTNGLTIATNNPLYIRGDYNTGTGAIPSNANTTVGDTNSSLPGTQFASPVAAGYTKQSAAVLADSVTFLSNNWNDSNVNPSTVLDASFNAIAGQVAVNMRPATHTTFNVGILAGGTRSANAIAGNPATFSGGTMNLVRLIEDWRVNGNTLQAKLTYYGSMIQLYYSSLATGVWVPTLPDSTAYYKTPIREFVFDDNFSLRQPPGRLDGVVVTRGSWQKL